MVHRFVMSWLMSGPYPSVRSLHHPDGSLGPPRKEEPKAYHCPAARMDGFTKVGIGRFGFHLPNMREPSGNQRGGNVTQFT
jgi:hypothetical protein